MSCFPISHCTRAIIGSFRKRMRATEEVIDEPSSRTKERSGHFIEPKRADERGHTRAYLLDEMTQQWQSKGTVSEVGFWP
jgi:hypothetical protein